MFINGMPTCERGLLFLNARKKLDLLTLSDSLLCYKRSLNDSEAEFVHCFYVIDSYSSCVL